jgi:LysR family transcriptional activator of nhaA
MRHLNYNHLFYFWTVAREGSISKACGKLHLTPQTVSAQIKLLEETVGEPLFDRVGRGLVLSEVGSMVMRYADEIFSAGMELNRFLRSGEFTGSRAFNVGITDSIAKLVAYRVLQPAMDEEADVKLVCEEGRLDRLLGTMATHRLDLIISDAPLPGGTHIKAFNHHLGHSEIKIFATPALAKKYRKKFPESLDGAPFLMPTRENAVRRALEHWFELHQLTPNIVAEVYDSALLKSFGGEGAGLFPGSAVIEDNIRTMYAVEDVGTAKGIHEQYYAISPERKIKQPVVLTICEWARSHVFS